MQTETQDAPQAPSSDPATPNEAGSSSIAFRNPKKTKPTQALPSDRVAADKQLEILRCFVAAVDAEGGPVTNDQAGKVIGMAGATVVVTNSFFVDTGLLVRTDAGTFNVGHAAREYQAAYQWDIIKAGRKLAPAFLDKWFCKVLIPRLKMRAFPRSEAVGFLAEACKASPEYRPRLEMILEFLSAAGIISADAAEVRIGSPVTDGESGGNVTGGGGGGSGGGMPPKDPPKDNLANEIPPDAPFLYLDAKRTKRVVIVSDTTELTLTEWKRLKAWFELQFFKPDEENPTAS